MAAASNGHLEAATSLVKAGAALDKQNNDGHSALMFAYNGRAQVCCCVWYLVLPNLQIFHAKDAPLDFFLVGSDQAQEATDRYRWWHPPSLNSRRW